MRVLLTSQPGSGHWRPLAPLALALQQRGHEVAFATLPAHCRWIEAAGFRSFEMGVDDDHSTPELTPGRSTYLTEPEQADVVWRRLFAGSRARACLPDLLGICDEWRPNLIMRETTEFAGCIAAEAVGLPHAAVQVSAYRPHLQALVAEPLNALRVACGLPRDPELGMLYRHLLLSPLPPTYRAAVGSLPPTTRSMRRVYFDRTELDEQPAWLDDQPTRPVVYVTLGTAYNQAPQLFTAILDGLSDEPVELIVTVGPGLDPGAFGPQPGNVHIHRHIAHSRLLSRCDLVVCHGGFGTLLDALSHDLPLLMLPIAADQPENARHAVALGVAELLPPEHRTPSAIRDATKRLLSETRYRLRAAVLAREIQRMPDPSAVVPLLEEMAVMR